MQQILFYITIILILCTLLPLIRHDFWIFRVFEYPRLQKIVINLLLLTFNISFMPTDTLQMIVFVALLLNLSYLIYQIFPFTLLGKKQIISARMPIGKNNITLLIANVYQDNRQSESYLKLIDKCNPDVVLMVETNKWWEQQMDVIGDDYPNQLKIPLENTYGMIFYSRLELRNGSINFLVEKDRKSTRLNSSHSTLSRMPSSA